MRSDQSAPAAFWTQFSGMCSCGRVIERSLPPQTERPETNRIWVRCSECSTPVYCRRGGLDSHTERVAVEFVGGGIRVHAVGGDDGSQ